MGSLIRRWRLVVSCGAVFVLLGLIYSAVKPVSYTATAQLLIYVREVTPGLEPIVSPGRADVTQVQNEIEILKSRSTMTKVIGALRLNQDVEFTSSGPPVLHLLKSLFSSELNAASDESRRTLEVAHDSLNRRLSVRRSGTSHTILVGVTASDPNKAALIANEVARTITQDRFGSDLSTFKTPSLKERLQGLGPSAYTISTADPPIRPDGPRTVLVVLAATCLGLGVGAGLALLLDSRDRTIRTREQVEDMLDLECLAVVPRVPLRGGHLGTRFAGAQGPASGPVEPGGGLDLQAWVMDDPHSPLPEALRRAWTVLQSTPEVRSLGITSAVSGEGATTIAANLACSIARSGKKVLIVDGARGRPSLSSTIVTDAMQRPGRLSGRRGILDSSVITDERTGLHMFAIGDPATANTDPACWTYLGDVLAEATKIYDLVVVDLPPLASGPDVRMAAQKLHGLLLVLKWGDMDAELVRHAVNSAGKARAKFVGAILNMVEEGLIGKYGDKLSEAEAALAARRRLDASRPGKRRNVACAS